MTRRVIALAVIAVASLLGGACARDPEPAAATVPRVVLPDLSSLAPSVQRQIRERDAGLTTALGNARASRADRAAAYGALGRMLMAAKFSDAAALCYLHAETLQPDDNRWPYYLGHAYLRKGDRERARSAFERALKLRPADLPTRIFLGETYLDDGRLDLAQAEFNAVLSLQPQSAAALFGAGRTALARQAYAEAVQNLERALASDPRASAVHYPLAMAYRALGDAAKSEAHVRQRGTVFPDLADPLMQQDDEVLDSAVAYEGRGMQALRDEDFAAAAAAFRKGLELEPDAASLRYWLGAALYAGGDGVGAEREFSAVARQSPGFAKAHFSLGAIYDGRGRRSEAVEAFRAAVQADPGMPEARFRLAEDLRATGQLDASLPQYEAAVKLDPSVAEPWIGGAHALLALGRNQQASTWLIEAQRIHPGRTELGEMQARLKSVR